MFGKSFVILWGFKWLGKGSAVESTGLALSLQAVSEFSGKQAHGNVYSVSEYTGFEGCKSFDVKSWLCLNCLLLHFQGFACF